MAEEEIKLLIVEDSIEYAYMLKMVLAGEKEVAFRVTHVLTLKDAIEALEQHPFEAVLLDLSLPDSLGLDTFLAIYHRVPHLPIIMITALDDEVVARKAVREGAQDYLVKGDLDINQLVRAIRYAILRKRTQLELEEKLLRDDLTGLYNRRGFIHLAEQQLKLANRDRRGLLLIYADMDGLKKINDAFGHQAGDQALLDVADLFNTTFRETDIVSRIGGDEFAILAVDVGENTDKILIERLKKNLVAYSENEKRPYKLSVSWGIAHFSRENMCTLDELIARADASMYEQKSQKKLVRSG